MPTVSSLTAPERETIVNASDADDLVRVWTAQRRYITKMRKSPLFTEAATGFHGKTEWAEFTIPADRWSPTGIRHSRAISTAQKSEAAARMSDIQRRASGQDTPMC